MSKNLALTLYILIGGLGLWLGSSATDLLDIGVIQPVINLLTNATNVGTYIVGAIIIYVLRVDQAELPKPPVGPHPNQDPEASDIPGTPPSTRGY